MTRYRIGVDVGGTFTDLVLTDRESGTVRIAKTPSSPDDPSRAILEGLDQLGVGLEDVEYFAHGTTVGTNALITRELPRTALICTKGFRDTLEIGRGPRPDAWDAYSDIAPAYVPRRDRFEVDERLDYRGEVVRDLNLADVRAVAERLRKRGIETVAVALLHSYVEGSHERAVRDVLHEEVPGVHVSVSHEVLPEIFEFERSSTTVINAALAPVVGRYVDALEAELTSRGFAGDVLVLHSGGGVMQAKSVRKFAARIAKSGPAAGAAAMAAVAKSAGHMNAIGLDVGGTSSDISLMVDGELRLSNETSVEYGHPILFPSVDVVTIGAGGGSVAWIDGGGALRNGPRSQKAYPGSACYLRGGTEPTNTDAHLVLGRLSEASFLGGRMAVSTEAAREAIRRRVAEPLRLSDMDAAAAIIKVANANMAGATRLVSIKRGYDPREFALVAFGGAGPLHAAEVAAELGIPTVVIPTWPGITSAYGCLMVDARHDLSRTFVAAETALDLSQVEEAFVAMETEARDRLNHEGFRAGNVSTERRVDMRYVGQWRSLTIPWLASADDLPAVLERFHAEHERAYAYSEPARSVEIYGLRVTGIGRVDRVDARRAASTPGSEPVVGTRPVYYVETDGYVETPILSHDRLASGASFVGPAIVQQMDSTVVVPPSWSASLTDDGTITLLRDRASDASQFASNERQ